jgi:hypothetical protein
MSGAHAKREMVTDEKPATSHEKAPSGESGNKKREESCNTPGSTNNPECYCTTLPTSIYKISAASPLQDCIKEGATEYKHIS